MFSCGNVLFSIVINTDRNQLLEERISLPIIEEGQGRKLKRATWMPDQGEAGFLPGSCWPVLFFLFFLIWDHLSRVGTSHSGLGPPTSLSRGCPTGLPTGQSYLGCFLN